MKGYMLWTLAVVFGLAVTRPANADLVSFSPTGNGAAGAVLVNTFDEAPGNALSKGGNTAVDLFVATGAVIPFTTYFQAQMGSVRDAAGAINTSGYGYTVVAGFSEFVAASFGTPGSVGNTVIFGLNPTAPGATNFFEIYATPTPHANDVYGSGFNDTSPQTVVGTPGATSAGNGPPGLTGTLTAGNSVLILAGTINFASTTISVLPGGGPGNPLDNNVNGLNSYPLISTINVLGSTTLSGAVTYFDPSFFPSNPGQFNTQITSTTNALAFNTVDPSSAFVESNNPRDFNPLAVSAGPQAVNDGAGAGAGTGTGSITAAPGGTNGSPIALFGGTGGPDIQFQADASTTLTEAATVAPEPSTLVLSLLAFGGLGLRTVVRRRGAQPV